MTDYHYHRDKHGASLRNANGYCLRDGHGQYVELFGTGISLSSDMGVVMVWTTNNKIEYRRLDDLTLVDGSCRAVAHTPKNFWECCKIFMRAWF